MTGSQFRSARGVASRGDRARLVDELIAGSGGRAGHLGSGPAGPIGPRRRRETVCISAVRSVSAPQRLQHLRPGASRNCSPNAGSPTRRGCWLKIVSGASWSSQGAEPNDGFPPPIADVQSLRGGLIASVLPGRSDGLGAHRDRSASCTRPTSGEGAGGTAASIVRRVLGRMSKTRVQMCTPR